MVPQNPPFLSGVPELLVLRLLAAREMYGYELARTIREVTGDAISVGENVLYPALHALEARGLLRARRHTVAGRTRVYYLITASGRRRLTRLTRDWRRISAGVHTALGVS